MTKLSFSIAKLLGVFFAALSIATPAAAYIGPGAGIGAIGTVIALFGAFLLLIFGFVWYPVKRLLRGMKAKKAEEAETANAETDGK